MTTLYRYCPHDQLQAYLDQGWTFVCRMARHHGRYSYLIAREP